MLTADGPVVSQTGFFHGTGVGRPRNKPWRVDHWVDVLNASCPQSVNSFAACESAAGSPRKTKSTVQVKENIQYKQGQGSPLPLSQQSWFNLFCLVDNLKLLTCHNKSENPVFPFFHFIDAVSWNLVEAHLSYYHFRSTLKRDDFFVYMYVYVLNLTVLSGYVSL